MYVKENYKNYLSSGELELLDEIFKYLCCMFIFCFQILFFFVAKNSEFFTAREIVDDMKELGCTPWIGRLVSGL